MNKKYDYLPVQLFLFRDRDLIPKEDIENTHHKKFWASLYRMVLGRPFLFSHAKLHARFFTKVLNFCESYDIIYCNGVAKLQKSCNKPFGTYDRIDFHRY